MNAPYKTIDELSHENRPLAEILEGHRKWLRGEGGERANLRKANLIGASLRGLYLIGADLSGAILVNADLKGTSLVGTTLKKANLSGSNFTDANLSGCRLVRAKLNGASLVKANLLGADLSGADLTGANLEGANLQDSTLKWSILKQANLSCANLTGAYLEEANFGGWTIKGAICNYIRSGSEKEIIRYGEGEFEKKFSFFKEASQLVLKIPFSISAVCVGKLIAQAINAVLNSEVICLKGVEALAQDCIKLSFFIMDRDFYEGKAKFFESYLRHALEDYFRENPVKEDPMCTSYLLEDEWNAGFDGKKLMSYASRFGEGVSKDLAGDSSLGLGKIGAAIHRIVASVFE